MKKGIRFFAMIIMLLMLGVTFRIVSAADAAVLYMRANVSHHTVVEASCEVRYTGKLTNGKIRILYDTEKLKLEESRVGERAESFLYEINDPIPGNQKKKENWCLRLHPKNRRR